VCVCATHCAHNPGHVYSTDREGEGGYSLWYYIIYHQLLNVYTWHNAPINTENTTMTAPPPPRDHDSPQRPLPWRRPPSHWCCRSPCWARWWRPCQSPRWPRSPGRTPPRCRWWRCCTPPDTQRNNKSVALTGRSPMQRITLHYIILSYLLYSWTSDHWPRYSAVITGHGTVQWSLTMVQCSAHYTYLSRLSIRSFPAGWSKWWVECNIEDRPRPGSKHCPRKNWRTGGRD